eukprot:TRINITY_DN12459_c0_g1_i2.p1 TRINITY_DN12459_c0_g1~~TRINITY_DN12459_c0_g1_i2.p1  ORF type:complete len:144 (+),score=40.65 TRINITY_DN12459_c0_g1_i2:199-630(+)
MSRYFARAAGCGAHDLPAVISAARSRGFSVDTACRRAVREAAEGTRALRAEQQETLRAEAAEAALLRDCDNTAHAEAVGREDVELEARGKRRELLAAFRVSLYELSLRMYDDPTSPVRPYRPYAPRGTGADGAEAAPGAPDAP